MKKLIMMIMLIASVNTAYAKIITTCMTGTGTEHLVQLIREKNNTGSPGDYLYYLKKDHNKAQSLYPGESDQSAGSSVMASCIGEQEHVLILSGEFSSAFIQGVAIRYNSKLKEWQRVNFAERERPMAVYLFNTGIFVIFYNKGRNESPQKYTVYKYRAGNGENAEQIYSDSLPAPKWRLIWLPVH
jgi:hypothetical protein